MCPLSDQPALRVHYHEFRFPVRNLFYRRKWRALFDIRMAFCALFRRDVVSPGFEHPLTSRVIRQKSSVMLTGRW